MWAEWLDDYRGIYWSGKCKGLKEMSVGLIYGTSLHGLIIVVISHGFHHVTHFSYLGKIMVVKWKLCLPCCQKATVIKTLQISV
jgi:hypothetical protein